MSNSMKDSRDVPHSKSKEAASEAVAKTKASPPSSSSSAASASAQAHQAAADAAKAAELKECEARSRVVKREIEAYVTKLCGEQKDRATALLRDIDIGSVVMIHYAISAEQQVEMPLIFAKRTFATRSKTDWPDASPGDLNAALTAIVCSFYLRLVKYCYLYQAQARSQRRLQGERDVLVKARVKTPSRHLDALNSKIAEAEFKLSVIDTVIQISTKVTWESHFAKEVNGAVNAFFDAVCKVRDGKVKGATAYDLFGAAEIRVYMEPSAEIRAAREKAGEKETWNYHPPHEPSAEQMEKEHMAVLMTMATLAAVMKTVSQAAPSPPPAKEAVVH